MKKMIFMLVVVGVLFGSTLCLADGPWPEPVETNGVIQELPS